MICQRIKYPNPQHPAQKPNTASNVAKMAKIPISGLKGNLKIKGLLVIYFLSFLVWTKDNSESLEKTMTSLDNHLDKAGKLLSIIKI